MGDIITERRREHNHRTVNTEALLITAIGVFVIACVLVGLIVLTWIETNRS